MPSKASTQEGLQIPTVWVAIVAQLVGLLFFAGVGWNRISNAETNITTLNTKFERYDEVKERLVKLEISLASLATSVERIASKIEVLGQGAHMMDNAPMRKR